MPPILQTFRDAEVSLWQSAVEQAFPESSVVEPPGAAEISLTPAGAIGEALAGVNPSLRSADHLGAMVQNIRSFLSRDPIEDVLPHKATLSAEDLPAAHKALANLEHFGLLAISLARNSRHDPLALLALLTTRYGKLDPRWAQAAINYFELVMLRRKGITRYVPYKKITDYVIEDKLPADARVALVSDLGTGRADAEEVLRQIAAKKPHVAIHLGDVYYAGTNKQFKKFRKQWDTTLGEIGAASFTLSGNHDMYSGGDPYYVTIEHFSQPASYFCLRNADWQFVAMDTGLTNSEIHFGMTKENSGNPHGIDEKEVEWVEDKIASAGNRRTILLSHHQLFSAFERLTNDGPVNEQLLNQFKEVLPSVSRWYWGHEHDLIIYDDAEKYQGVLGRCIGHGAIPIDKATYRLSACRPHDTAGFSVPAVANVRLELMAENPNYYNHGYVIIDMHGPHATATYYQASQPDKILYTEKLS